MKRVSRAGACSLSVRCLTIEHPQHGRLDVLGFPIKFSDAPCLIHRPPPDLGVDNEVVLGQLGLSAEAITSLKSRGII